MRILYPINKAYGIEEVFCTFIRAGAETMRASTGPVDTIVVDDNLTLSFLKQEIQYAFPKPLILSSFKVPTILLSVASIFMCIKKNTSSSEIKDVLSKIPRTLVVEFERDLRYTDAIYEYVRRVRRPLADIYELYIWNEQTEVANGKSNQSSFKNYKL